MSPFPMELSSALECSRTPGMGDEVVGEVPRGLDLDCVSPGYSLIRPLIHALLLSKLPIVSILPATAKRRGEPKLTASFTGHCLLS